MGQFTEAFIGEIRLFAGSFAPSGWSFCQGQLLDISQHQALYAILGGNYGGDGRTSFGLPDLRGRTPIQQGTGLGLYPVNLAERDVGKTWFVPDALSPKETVVSSPKNRDP